MMPENKIRAFLADLKQVCDRSYHDAKSPQDMLHCAVSVIVAEAMMDLLEWVLGNNSEYDRIKVEAFAKMAAEARAKQGAGKG